MFTYLKNFFTKPGPHYSLLKVCFILLLTSSTVFLLYKGGSFGVNLLKKVSKGNTIPIRKIAQTGPAFFQLSSHYLAEVLDLSQDHPTNLAQFDLKKAKKTLYQTHLIKKVRLKKVKPDILYIEYLVREPIAFLEDMSNTAFDEDGHLFAFSPFFFPKNLPRVFLGSADPAKAWGEKIEHDHMELIVDLCDFFKASNIHTIDLSRINSESYGKNEIIVQLNGGRNVRLSLRNYLEELERYTVLDQYLLKEETPVSIIDLRVKDVAYIEKGSKT